MEPLQKERKIVVGMVGLPARGKSYIGRKISRYLNWQQIKSEVFNIGQYRRKLFGTKECSADFFNPDNPEGMKAREQCAALCLEDMVDFLDFEEGEVAIYDGTNSTAARRKLVKDTIQKELPNARIIWVESICDDDKIIEQNIRDVKLSNPDYKEVDPEAAIQDFLGRIEQYKKKYEPVDEKIDGDDICYIKVYDVGKTVRIFNIQGYLESKLCSFLMNLHANPHPLYLVRNGESQFVKENRMGGDSDLTENGIKFAKLVGQFFEKERKDGNITQGTKVFTSTLKRAINTAQFIDQGITKYKFKLLDELNCGLYEGLTHQEMKDKNPNDYEERKRDKLNYRYPRGESYLDLIHRLEPLIYEMERNKDPVIVVAHNCVLRCLYAYFSKHEIKQVPFIDVPLNSIIKLEPTAYFSYEKRYTFDLETGNMEEKENPKPLFLERSLKKTSSTIFLSDMNKEPSK